MDDIFKILPPISERNKVPFSDAIAKEIFYYFDIDFDREKTDRATFSVDLIAQLTMVTIYYYMDQRLGLNDLSFMAALLLYPNIHNKLIRPENRTLFLTLDGMTKIESTIHSRNYDKLKEYMDRMYDFFEKNKELLPPIAERLDSWANRRLIELHKKKVS